MRTHLRLLRKFLPAVILFFFSLQAFAFTPTALSRNGKLSVSGLQLVNECGQPVYLRGISSYHYDPGWCSGCCHCPDSFDFIANTMTADVFRLALTPPVTGVTYEMSQIIEKTKQLGMYCIIDWHVLSPGDPNVYVTQAETFWANMAQVYRDDKHLLFEICNEPNGVTWPVIRLYEDRVITAIRQYDPDRVIIAGTPNWSQLGSDVLASPITWTANVMYTFHFYANSHTTDMLYPYANKLPIFVTEWGATSNTGDGPLNTANAQAFIDIMSGNNLGSQKMSWATWSFINLSESSAQLNSCAAGVWDYSRLTEHGQFVMSAITNTAGAPNTCLTPTDTPTPDPAIPVPTPRAVHKLNLQVNNTSGDACSNSMAQYNFNIINNDTGQVDLSSLQIKMWFYDGSGQGYVWFNMLNMPTASDTFGNPMPTPVETISMVFTAAAPCTTVADRKNNFSGTVSFTSGYKILPGYSCGKLTAVSNRPSFASPFDQFCDDYSRTTSTAYEENPYFALYENGILVDEWLSPSVADPNTGREPCSASQTPTATFTITTAMTPTYTQSLVADTPSITCTATPTFTCTPGQTATITPTAVLTQSVFQLDATDVLVYPNPCKDILKTAVNFDGQQADIRVKVFTMDFRKIYSYTGTLLKSIDGFAHLDMDVSKYSNGCYAAVFEIGRGSSVKRIVRIVIVLK